MTLRLFHNETFGVCQLNFCFLCVTLSSFVTDCLGKVSLEEKKKISTGPLGPTWLHKG